MRAHRCSVRTARRTPTRSRLCNTPPCSACGTSIPVGECKAIEKAAGNVAPAFYAAAKAPRLQDSISETMDKAKKDGKELGSKLEDTLNNQLPQLFDDAMNLFRDQMRQYNKEKPEAPTNL